MLILITRLPSLPGSPELIARHGVVLPPGIITPLRHQLAVRRSFCNLI
jgi:hypothetical protein